MFMIMIFSQRQTKYQNEKKLVDYMLIAVHSNRDKITYDTINNSNSDYECFYGHFDIESFVYIAKKK